MFLKIALYLILQQSGFDLNDNTVYIFRAYIFKRLHLPVSLDFIFQFKNKYNFE